MVEGAAQAVDQRDAADAGAGLQAEPGIALVEEGSERTETEGTAKTEVVAECGMGIEWQVGAVDGEVCAEEQPELPVTRPGPRMGRRPEETVVDDQEIGLGVDGALEGGEGGVDGGGDAGNPAVILDLEAVGGAVPVVELWIRRSRLQWLTMLAREAVGMVGKKR
jgi:hypothetical protein